MEIGTGRRGVLGTGKGVGFGTSTCETFVRGGGVAVGNERSGSRILPQVS